MLRKNSKLGFIRKSVERKTHIFKSRDTASVQIANNQSITFQITSHSSQQKMSLIHSIIISSHCSGQFNFFDIKRRVLHSTKQATIQSKSFKQSDRNLDYKKNFNPKENWLTLIGFSWISQAEQLRSERSLSRIFFNAFQ